MSNLGRIHLDLRLFCRLWQVVRPAAQSRATMTDKYKFCNINLTEAFLIDLPIYTIQTRPEMFTPCKVFVNITTDSVNLIALYSLHGNRCCCGEHRGLASPAVSLALKLILNTSIPLQQHDGTPAGRLLLCLTYTKLIVHRYVASYS